MIDDHRPYYIKRLYLWCERFYTQHFVAAHFESLGVNPHIMKPWNLRVHGAGISIGRCVHIVTAADRMVGLSTWAFEEHQGQIQVGDNCLICPGVRIDSASKVQIDDNCMLAAGAYVTDADWHDIYDRTKPVGTTRPVHLCENVWIGDGATICKGVTIGRNSVIGAGAVVTGDIPEDVIAAGNPAKVVKTLDPDRKIVTRASLFSDPEALREATDRIDRYVLTRNSWLGWVRTLLAPRSGD